MEGIESSDIPPAKRQKVARLPGGQYYPEQDWINLHPVSDSSPGSTALH
jgi:splicing factor 3A subunit 1